MRVSGRPAGLFLFSAALMALPAALGDSGGIQGDYSAPIKVVEVEVESVQHGAYESEDKAVGCDCAKDDIGELLRAQPSVLLPVSLLVFSAGSNLSSLDIGDIQYKISSIIYYGIEVLGLLKCGGCVDSLSGLEQSEIYTYDCCCDSDAIKDVIKDTLNAIALAVPLIKALPNAPSVFYALVNKYVQSAILAIMGIIDDYEGAAAAPAPTSAEEALAATTDQNAVTCPCFDLDDLHAAYDDGPRQIDDCYDFGSSSVALDLDYGDVEMGFCVGTDCDLYHGMDGQLRCWAGAGWYDCAGGGCPGEFEWMDGRFKTVQITQGQATVCGYFIHKFCQEKQHTVMMDWEPRPRLPN